MTNIKAFRISNENIERLNLIANKYNISKSKLINILIENNLDEMSNKPILKSTDSHNKSREVRVKLTNEEYELLNKSAKNNLRSSVQNELKFHAFNAICDTKILDHKELEQIALTRCELNKIGSNINQIARALNSQNSFNVGVDFLEIFNDLDLKIQKLAKEIKILATKTI